MNHHLIQRKEKETKKMNGKKVLLIVVALLLVTACAGNVIVNCPPGAASCTLVQAQGTQVRRGNVPIVTQMPKPTEGNFAVTLTPGGLSKGTTVPTPVPGFDIATKPPTLVPQSSPTPVLDSTKKKTEGEKRLQKIFKELNLRGTKFQVKTLSNGVIVIPDDGSNDSVLIKSIMTAAQIDKQEIMVEIQSGDMTDRLIQHMLIEGNQFFIGVNDEPAKSLVSGQLKVREGSTVIYVEMYPARLMRSNLGVHRTLLVTPNPGGPYAIYVELAASLLKKGGMGKILLHPDFAFGQRLNMPTAAGHVTEIASDFGAESVTEYISVRDLILKYPDRYTSPILDAYERTDNREIFRLITVVKK